MRLRHIRRAVVVALVPALAFAAPKKKKTTKPPPVETPTGSDAGSAAGSAAPTPDAPQKDTKAPPSTTPATPAGGGAGSAGSGSGSGGGSGEAKEQEPPKSEGPDVDALRQEYLQLRDELFKSRARANAVASQLYSTRVTIKFTWGSGRYYGVSKSSIRLDGATVYENVSGEIANDDGIRFDGYVAPGRHLVTFHVEATGKDDDSFTSSTESQIVVKAVAGKDLVVSAKGKDSGDIAYEWKRKEKGSYGLGIDVSVKSVTPAAEGGGGKKK